MKYAKFGIAGGVLLSGLICFSQEAPPARPAEPASEAVADPAFTPTPAAAPAPTPFERARELYKEGPSKAPEIIALLKEELLKNPGNEQAIRLLGITYFGVGEWKLAIEQFDAILVTDAEKPVIHPKILFYKAWALHQLGQDQEAKQILDAYWAFFQDKGELQSQYEQLAPAVEKSLAAAK